MVLVLTLGLMAPASSFAATAEDVAALPTLDALNRSESTLSNGGRWAKLNWATGPGTDTTSGWYTSYAYPTVVGAYWTPSAFSDRYGDAASLKMAAGPGSNIGRYVSLWLDMPEPGAAKSGYQLSWAMNSDLATYTVKLTKWSAGTEALLASNASVTIPAGSTLAISDTGGTLTAWLDTGSGTLAPLLSASDSVYASGFAGIEASGNVSRSLNFKAGALMGAATQAVPVLDSLERSEAPIATGNWTKTNWTDNFGGAYCCKTARGYGGIGLTGTSGAYWNVAPSRGGVLVSAAVGSGAPAAGDYLGLWLDMPSPGSERSGYEARFSGVDGTATNYKVELAKWVGGSRTVLAVKEGFSLAAGTTIALTESGGGLTVWSGTNSLAPVLSAGDTTYSSGYAGLEVGGGVGSLYNFRAGSIAQAPTTTITTGPSGTVVSHVSLRFNASEEGAGFECSLDGAAYTACTSAKAYTSLADGSHKFRVRATNEYGVDPTPAERSFQSYTAAPSKVPLLDAFERAEVPLATSQWTKTFWGGSIGGVWWGGYRGYGSSGGLASAYWNANLFKDTAGSVLAAATIGTGSPGTSEYMALLLNLQSPGSAHSGYEARLTGTGTTDVYKLEISKWISGARTVLALKEGLVLPPDTVIALAETETHLTFWKGTAGSFSSQLSVTDTGATRYASGNAGLEVQGPAGTLYRFRAGNIDLVAPETTILTGPNGTTVPPENVSFSFFSSESGSTFECALDSGAYSACVSPKAYPEIGQGPHTFRVRATDKVGNVDATPAERSFQVLSKPMATTDPATEVKTDRATLNATVNPKESATTYQFEYGTTTAYGSVVPATAASAGSGDSPIAVSQVLTGLAPDTEYHFRISATNPQGTTKGADRTFVTTTAPVVVTGPTANLEAFKGDLTGTVDPKGAETTYYFQYGPTTAYGSKVPATAKSAGSGRGAVSVTETAEGLSEGALYHYRLVATNEAGTSYGADQIFETPRLPEVETEAAHEVTANEAVLMGTVDPNGEPTTYKFQYGTTAGYGETVPPIVEEEETGDLPVEAEEGIAFLQPETTYHYRVVATSAAGTVVGPDQTLTTAPRTETPEQEAQRRQAEASGVSAPGDFVNIHWSGDTPRTASKSVMEMVRGSGAKMLRMGIGRRNDTFDTIFRLAGRKGITILPGLGGNHMEDQNSNGIRPGWRDFVRDVVKAYGRGGEFWQTVDPEYRRAPQYWEIWNEENYGTNGDSNGHPNPAAYGDLLEEASTVIHEVDPQAKILVGGLLTVGKQGDVPKMPVGEFIRKMGHPGAYDALGLHPYAFKGDVEEITNAVRRNIQEARAALNDKGGREKKIWVNELGWPVKGPMTPNDGSHVPVSEEMQKKLLNSTFNMIKANRGPDRFNIENVFYYNIQDYEDPNHEHNNWAYRAGLREELKSHPAANGAHENGRYREAWYAFQNQAGFTGTYPKPSKNNHQKRVAKPKRLLEYTMLNPYGSPTEYWIKWGPGWNSTTYENFTTAQNFGDEVEEADVEKESVITGLQPKTKYHYAVVAENDAGQKSETPDMEFETPPSSSTSNDVKRVLHGQPGYVWIQGWVKEGEIEGSLPGLSNVHVHIKLYRDGVYQRFVDVMTNSEGHYESGYIEVGKGAWETKTEFPGGLEWDPSESGVKEFHVRDGVRIRAQHSGGCWDIFGAQQNNGAAVMHGACNEPVTSNQVFSLVPQEGGQYLQIIARNSGKCVDVDNASTADGAGLQQYDCLGVGQANQLFREAWSGEWLSYVAKHSNKCVDVTGANMGWINLQQWTCNGTSQQAYRLEPVESGPIPTETFLTVAPVIHGNGQYGNWGLATYSGHLLAGAYSMANRTVRIQIQKAVNGQWVQTDELPLTVNSDGSYRFNDYGLAPGIFRARAVFIGDGQFARSESDWHQFAIWQANRLVARHSGKCMSLSDAAHQNFNGQPMIQWDCSPAPSFGDGQTLWFWPVGNNVYEITVIATGKCLDVAGWENGAQLQQWDCTHNGNQRFQVLEISGQPGWYAIRPVHDYRCLDVAGAGTGNGTKIQQWDCHWGGNQQWEIQGVISG